MSLAFERLLALTSPFVTGRSRPDWGTDRNAIRRSLAEEFKTSVPNSNWEKTILDLAELPTHPNLSISISHTAVEGAWVSAENFYVGLDIERSDRLTPRLIARVATEAERARTPDDRYLWCAKEAAFKALSARAKSHAPLPQAPPAPKTIGEIEILNWSPRGEAQMFKGFLGQGWLVDGGDRLLALYLVPK